MKDPETYLLNYFTNLTLALNSAKIIHLENFTIIPRYNGRKMSSKLFNVLQQIEHTCDNGDEAVVPACLSNP